MKTFKTLFLVAVPCAIYYLFTVEVSLITVVTSLILLYYYIKVALKANEDTK